MNDIFIKSTIFSLLLSSSMGIAQADMTINVKNAPSADEAFNDATPATPVGGNPGTTLGEQRQLAFNYAMDIISQSLNSVAPIKVRLKTLDIPSNEFGTILAGAGPLFFLNGQEAGWTDGVSAKILYPSALAKKISKSSLSEEGLLPPNNVDIVIVFNTAVDDGIVYDEAGSTWSWYYGLDAQPQGYDVDFVETVLHEMLHGLGFLDGMYYTNKEAPDGSYYFGDPLIYDTFLHQASTTPSALSAMNQNKRLKALTSEQLYWDGTVGNFYSQKLTDGLNGNNVKMFAPTTFQPGSSISHSDETVFPDDLMEAYSNETASHNLRFGAAVLSDIGWGNYSDLKITAELPQKNVMPNISYTLAMTVSNIGMQAAPDSVLTYTLPTNTELMVPADTSQGKCTTAGKQLKCELGTITAGRTVNINARLISSTSGKLTHAVKASADIVEADITNNKASVTSN
jgi:hypothetical protein